MTQRFYAHSGRCPDQSDWQLLREHLLEVARLCRQGALDACPNNPALSASAFAAGLLHDLGKYRPEFQAMIKGLPVQKGLTYHKQAGAAKAVQSRHAPLACAIAGHHGGLPDKADLESLLRGPSGLPVARAVWPTAVEDCPKLARLSIPPQTGMSNLDGELFTRLLFSCLVDADWTDTTRFYGKDSGAAPPALDAAGWLERVLTFIGEKAASCRERNVAVIRDEILKACLYGAEQAPGLFSLTVPTGGGKTLSGLAFALKHAAIHGLRRVIYVAPYLSILDQNARVIREALGVGREALDVLEHQSLAEPPGSEDGERTDGNDTARRAENWDSPVIITTNVQFFESLFASKPGRCRKVHNVARSVIVLDECQSVPPGLVAPTCSMLGQLATQLGCSAVLCTATQPTFDHEGMPERLQGVREIIPPALNLFGRLRRVCVSWPGREETLDWPAIAGRMLDHEQALCIVNTRRAARELFQAVRSQTAAPVFHLSTSMCPAHRLAVLDRVRELLREKKSCYLVSTQLIEAGVDIDFPIVLRELAPFEAIIQAAGRCNREGMLNTPAGEAGGRVVVFRSVEGVLPPDRWYMAGRSVLETSFLNNGRQPRFDEPGDLREYFERLYWTGDLDEERIQALREHGDFRTVAMKYRLIDDDSVPVVVATWKDHAKEIEDRLEEVRRRPVVAAYRRLVPFQVNVRRYEWAKLVAQVPEEGPGLDVWSGTYDADLGLMAADADQVLTV